MICKCWSLETHWQVYPFTCQCCNTALCSPYIWTFQHCMFNYFCQLTMLAAPPVQDASLKWTMYYLILYTHCNCCFLLPISLSFQPPLGGHLILPYVINVYISSSVIGAFISRRNVRNRCERGGAGFSRERREREGLPIHGYPLHLSDIALQKWFIQTPIFIIHIVVVVVMFIFLLLRGC